MPDNSMFRILHISDLHIKKKDEFDRSVVLDPLIDRVVKDREAGLTPEIVVVTGDIAFSGKKEEYETARAFFDTLLSALDLSNRRLFITPGNHDVDRKKYRPSDRPIYENMKALNDELEDEDYRADLLKGMNDFFRFIETCYPHMKPVRGRAAPFAEFYRTRGGKRIGLLGLNSAWMCRRSPDEREIAIGEFQVRTAMAELSKQGDIDLQINLFHHPLDWLWPKDRSICRGCFNNTILLCGHLHDAAGGYTSDLDGSLFQFQAGGAYLGSESKWPARFQYISIDWDAKRIRLDFRKYMKDKRKWALDADTGDDGAKDFQFIGAGQPKSTEEMQKTLERDAVFGDYTRFMANEHRHLSFQGFETSFRHPIELERVYIHMRACFQTREFAYNLEGKKRLAERMREERLASLDIKAAFEALKRHKIKDMVILGDPGSGKTTLLKYILLMIIDGKAEDALGLSDGRIPFFAPLRELRDPIFESFTDFIKRACWIDRFSIPDESFNALLNDGRGVILLDGLDEVANEETRIKTCEWIDRARKTLVRTPFLITSRFAGYMGKSRLAGNTLELSIQDFTPEEVETFLIRWFETVEVSLRPGPDEIQWREKGREEALKLVERIRQSPHIQKLAVNPLLLQIIALVHRDRGALPQRRVELYDECTNVLLEKWDMAKGLDVPVTAREARRILQPLALWLHEKDQRRSAPIPTILNLVENSLEAMGKSGVAPGELLRNIRDRSGVFMGYSETEYGFSHLSFQEYLAAEQIRNTGKIDLLLEKYGERWWREVIRLCLALDNPSVIEEFMTRIISTEIFKTDIGLVVDAVNDSILKPAKPFMDAVIDADLPRETRRNAARVLGKTGGSRAVRALKDAVEGRDKKMAVSAFEALESMNAAEGVARPVIAKIPKRFKNPGDGSMMVLIPGGEFLYGSREDDKLAGSDEKPQRVIHLPAFYMDVHPVTNELFCEFLNRNSHDEKILNEWIALKGEWQNERCRITKYKDKYIVEKGYENHPIIFVGWHGANEYASWAGKRLPTEKEWEKAARGTEGGIYPWGDVFDKNLCNSKESGVAKATEVGRFPGGESLYGCRDMAGNVWEWTDSWYDDDKDFKVLRGGSWFSDSSYCRCAACYSNHPLNRNFDIGFRCARTYTLNS